MSYVKSIIKKIVPTRVWNRAHLFRASIESLIITICDYFYDMMIFIRESSAIVLRDNEVSSRKRLIKDYHVIEKGLSLPEPRPGFGRDIVDRVIAEIKHCETKYGPDRFTRAARDSLKQYIEFGSRHGLRFDNIEEFLENDVSNNNFRSGGTVCFEKSKLVKSEDVFFADFASRRYSVRNFTGEEVSEAALLRAVEISLKTPSVCNRQACKAYIIRDRQLIDKALSFQNGNRGFGDRASALFIITADIRSFMYTGERNQGWIDGGLFAMSLGYAVHSLGYGSCMLNWSVDSKKDKMMKVGLSIPRNENVVMMMAVGVIPNQIEVAVSTRKSLAETAILMSRMY